MAGSAVNGKGFIHLWIALDKYSKEEHHKNIGGKLQQLFESSIYVCQDYRELIKTLV